MAFPSPRGQRLSPSHLHPTHIAPAAHEWPQGTDSPRPAPPHPHPPGCSGAWAPAVAWRLMSRLWLPGPPSSKIIVSMCGIHSKPLNPRPELQGPSLIVPGAMAGLLTVPWVGRWVAQGFHLRLKSWPLQSLLLPCQLLCGLFCMTTALTTLIYPHFSQVKG